MGVKLVAEVLDHAPADWTPAERLFVAVLAEKARDSTRRAWPGQTTIARRTGLKAESVTRMCHRLAGKGWELREQQGVDRNGRPVFAHSGQSAVYRIPKLCPLGNHDPDVCFPSEARTTVRPSDPESPDGGPGIEQESPDGGPGIAEERADHRPAKTGPPSGQTAERPDGGPPLTVKVQPSGNPHTTAPPSAPEEETPKPPPTAKPTGGRQKPLIPETAIRLPQATQIVLDGLHAAGHPNATPDDARAVHQAVCAKYGSRVNLGWLRTMASNRSYGPFYQDVRSARAEQVEAVIGDLQRTEPACEHDTAAGQALHPTTGLMLCPLCREGVPAVPDEREHTHPAIAAALNAYRDNTTGPLNALSLMRITQEATALHNRQIPGEILAQLAAKAAQNNTGLLAAATAQ